MGRLIFLLLAVISCLFKIIFHVGMGPNEILMPSVEISTVVRIVKKIVKLQLAIQSAIFISKIPTIVSNDIPI